MWIITFLISSCNQHKPADEKHMTGTQRANNTFFEYADISGIGYEKGMTRRDPSDIIKTGNTFYIWYTKVPANTNGQKTPLYPSGYYGTIWYATSADSGFSWSERGQALAVGLPGAFDSHAVFTPNILFAGGKYYLFFTGVKPTPGNPDGVFENNSVNDYTAIGIAVADSPDGPFTRINENPALTVSKDREAFDSYRVDDAALLVRDNRYYLYYKGRSVAHGEKGPRFTRMGVATAGQPGGPYLKTGKPILDKSHEVLIWNAKDGVYALASISKTIDFAPDGIHFSIVKKVTDIPSAPGLYRPHLTDHARKDIPGWGISMKRKGKDIYLVRFEMKVK